MIVEFPGFKRLERPALVEAGATTTVNLVVPVGDVTETVNVVAATPILHTGHHQVGGLVGRAQIENLPLNGRSFLELARLEPGVASPVRLNDNRTFVSFLGAGLQTIPRIGYTRVTVDGFAAGKVDCQVLTAEAPNSINGPALTKSTMTGRPIAPAPIACSGSDQITVSIPPSAVVSLVAERR